MTEAIVALSATDIHALVERAVRRDAEAFGALYDAYLDPIYRYLYYRLGNQSETEDLCEQVFLKAWQAIGRFRWQGKPFSAWLFRLAHNALVDHLRTRKPTLPLDEVHADSASADHDWVSARLEAEELAAALARLTEEQRQVILLRFVSGLENAEIAEVMGKREGAVRALQLRGLQALRRILGEERSR